MHLTPEQYHRFLNGQCSEEERDRWIEYFKDHPEQLEEYMNVEAWNRFQPDEELHPGVSDRMLYAIRSGLRKKYRIHVKILAAAICIGVIILAVQQAMVKPVAVPKKVAALSWYSIVNKADTVRAFVLSDSSIVELHPASVLKYKNTREVYLSGEATFRIKKKTHQPFTVYAGGIATTALGTAFKVTVLPGKRTEVKLYSGKVVIRPVNNQWKQVFLKPGDNFILQQNKYLVKPSKPVAKKTPVKHKTIAPVNVFENTPLAEVLKRLISTYNIKIRFNEAEIREVFVTATFDRHDTPGSILETLCTLNRLQVTHNDGEFIISR